MSIFRKAKKFLEDADDTHDRLNAGFHRAIDDEDELMSRRDDARETLGDIGQEEADEDDGRLVHFPNPGREWTKKKNQRFLELTNTPEVLQSEEERAIREDPAVAAARAAEVERIFSSRQEIATEDAERRYKAKKGTW